MELALLLVIGCTRTKPAVERLLAQLPPSTEVVARSGAGWPVVAVVEVAAGDPRGTDEGGGAEVVRALIQDGTMEVYLQEGDGIDALVEGLGDERRAQVHVLPRGTDDGAPAVRRFARLVEAPETPLAGLRDMVLSQAAPASAKESYVKLRTESLARFDALSAELAAQGRLLADAVSGGDGVVVLGVPGLAVQPAVDRLREEGATFVVLRPQELAERKDEAMWWAGLRAALPPVVPEEDGLPSFGAWVEALGPAASAVAAWDEAEETRQAIAAEVGPVPPALAPQDPRRASLATAAQRLSGLGLPALTDADRVLSTLKLCDHPLAGTPMSYDPLFDALKVDPGVVQLPPEMVAAVLAHELTHARDLRAAAAELGTDPAGWALIHDTLPAGVMRGITFLAEDRAFRVEMRVLDTMGVALPAAVDAERIVQDPSSSEPDRLAATLAMLRADGPGTLPWMQELARMVPSPK